MNQDDWCEIPDTNGNYQASISGEIKSLARGKSKILRPSISRSGYYRVSICLDGKKKSRPIHQLVAAAFFGSPPLGRNVNHKDGVKSNNKPSNLEYVTRSENIKHAVRMGLLKNPQGESHVRSKLTNDQVLEIRGRLLFRGAQAAMAKEFGIDRSIISEILSRKRWAHVPSREG